MSTGDIRPGPADTGRGPPAYPGFVYTSSSLLMKAKKSIDKTKCYIAL